MSQSRIGFMQGRLSPLVDGRIQAFPWQHWRDEFPGAQSLGFGLLEWTLDQARLYENPLLADGGDKEIIGLCKENHIQIPSLTGDCFMQAPFWKADAGDRKDLQEDFKAVLDACSRVGIRMIVVPLVDNGRIENTIQEDILIDFLSGLEGYLRDHGLKIIFESDFGPSDLWRFICKLSPDCFGINYDIGNSAALGYSPKDEFDSYGSRIENVHVKDRILGGTTVPLGTGNADFETVFKALADIKYRGNVILQTARASDGNHAGALCSYRDLTIGWMRDYGLNEIDGALR